MHILNWNDMGEAARARALQRPAQQNADAVQAQVRTLIDEVRRRGDAALREYSQRFDGVAPSAFEVTTAEFAQAEARLDPAQCAAIDHAIDHVSRFHRAQNSRALRIEPSPGVVCERIVRPLRAVGLYVPAGSAPLPSTAIMLAVPAAIAGCEQRILCTPPRADGQADPAVLVAARKAGATRVFKIGGAQAVAALAYGTASVPKCDKIFGPGNIYVTAAKQCVAQDPAGAACDLPAGPSEVLVIADAAAVPEFVAADLLAQAEHSGDAQALLVTDDAPLAQAVAAQIEVQQAQRRRREILAESVPHIRLIVAPDLQTAFDISNRYAPEHLIVQVSEPRHWLPRILDAGAVFLGAWSPESVGDYCAGPNHTLPTYGYARVYSGLGLEDFQKRISVQELTLEGLRALAPTTRTLALLEGLDAHAHAVDCRLAAASA